MNTHLLRAAAGGALLGAMVLPAVTGTPAASAAVGDCVVAPDWGANRPESAARVVALVNEHRFALGLARLAVSPSLTRAAEWKAAHMAGLGYLQHDDPAPPAARTVADRLEACGYASRSSGWGENIAYGYASPDAVMTGWLGSPGHRANIEKAAFRSIGVGAAASANGTLYWAQAFGTDGDSTTPTPPPAAAPTITVTGRPASRTTARRATVAWTTTGTVTTTTCAVDGAAAVPCTSPTTITGVTRGTHTIRVTVANAAGAASASVTWRRV